MSARRRRVGSESDQQTVTLSVYEGKRYEGLSSQPHLIPIGMARDRTNEFAKAVQSVQGRQIVRLNTVEDPNRAHLWASYSEFMMLARTVGKNISSTFTKLEKLTLLAKRKSLFNDQPTEIQELTYIIKEDLNSLNAQIAQLQTTIRIQNEKKSRSKAAHLMSHSSTLVLALQSKLASMSSQFKHVLEVRTENLKEAKKRRDHFSHQGPLSNSLPQAAMTGGMSQGSVLLAQDRSVSIDMNHDPGDSQLRQQQQAQKQMQMVPYDETEQYLTSRAETMQNIESTIVELGGIFQQLAHMVKEQEEMVDRIDANVHDTELNVEAAHREILKYFQSVTSNRWLMIKIFGVLIFFFIFFLVFMA